MSKDDLVVGHSEFTGLPGDKSYLDAHRKIKLKSVVNISELEKKITAQKLTIDKLVAALENIIDVKSTPYFYAIIQRIAREAIAEAKGNK